MKIMPRDSRAIAALCAALCWPEGSAPAADPPNEAKTGQTATHAAAAGDQPARPGVSTSDKDGNLRLNFRRAAGNGARLSERGCWFYHREKSGRQRKGRCLECSAIIQ